MSIRFEANLDSASNSEKWKKCLLRCPLKIDFKWTTDE